MTAGMLLIGLIYFGPGLAKLQSAGLAWGWSDNLTNLMYIGAWEKGHAVPWLVEYPLAGRVLGVGVLLFELLFLPLLLVRKLRPWLVAAGLLFHVGAAVLLGIRFISLMLMYANSCRSANRIHHRPHCSGVSSRVLWPLWLSLLS